MARSDNLMRAIFYGCLLRFLTEQNLLRVFVVSNILPEFNADAAALLHCRTRHQGHKPSFEVGEIIEILTLSLVGSGPSDRSHIYDRVLGCQKLTVSQPPVHHAIKLVDLVGLALDRIRHLLGRKLPEMMRLPHHRAVRA